MGSTIIYNQFWVESTLQRLQQEINQTVALRNQLNSVRNATPPEKVGSVLLVMHEVERLERSLRITQNAFQRFKESSEINNKKAIMEYEGAENLAVHIFY